MPRQVLRLQTGEDGKLRRVLLLAGFALPVAPCAWAASELPDWSIPALVRICEAFRSATPPEEGKVAELLGRSVTPYLFERDGDRVLRIRFAEADDSEIVVAVSLPGSEHQRASLVGALPREDGKGVIPVFSVAAGADCRPTHANALALNSFGLATWIIRHSGARLETSVAEPLNPPVPAGRDPGGVRVAQIDTGVAYTVPAIAARLARDAKGAMLGYDFADDDARPFDREPGQPILFAKPHGTGVAAALLREAPGASLIPLRAPAKDALSLVHLPAEAVRRGAAIVMMSLGSLQEILWGPLVAAAGEHPEVLFVVAAGSEGRDLDPLYSASPAPPNMVVVTSAETDGRLASETNWGARSVDLAVPAERVATLSLHGAPAMGSGADYAAARVAALAARILEKNPARRGAALKEMILKHAEPLPDAEARPVRAGWIEDPATIER